MSSVYRGERREYFRMNARPVIGREMSARAVGRVHCARYRGSIAPASARAFKSGLLSLRNLGSKLGISAFVQGAELEIAPENRSVLSDDEDRAAGKRARRIMRSILIGN